MPPRCHHLIKPNQDHHRQSSHKQICRSQKRRSRLLHPPEIDDRQYNQHEKAESQSVRLQPGHRRNQSSDSRRDSHRHIQQVIDHQSRARQYSRPAPQILPSDGIRSPAHRISRNRLPITEKHNHQQPNDRRRQRHNVPDPQQPQRQQNRQSRLRPVSRRTQSIQPKSRNPLRRSNPLPLIFRRSQRPSKQNINESHIPSHPATIPKPEPLGDPPPSSWNDGRLPRQKLKDLVKDSFEFASRALFARLGAAARLAKPGTARPRRQRRGEFTGCGETLVAILSRRDAASDCRDAACPGPAG